MVKTEAPASIANFRPDEHLVGDQFADDERLSSVGRPNYFCSASK